jgi:fructosamine-3-kinase
MSVFDSILYTALHAAADASPIQSVTPVGGGSISRVARVRTGAGEYALKWSENGTPGFFAAEAHGLALPASTGAVRVPRVLALRDEPREAAFLLLEWLAAPAGASRATAGEILGRQLAALHRATAPNYGLDRDNFIGATPQPNGWMDSWLEFFRERRLRFQGDVAQRNGYLTGERARLLERLLERLDSWIDDRLVQPALLHGDLWGGNFIIGPGGAPALIDPAVYYGDREADLAFTTLFGGFPETFYRAYEETWPLVDGWRDRRDLYNLYHLLNHLNLFGEGYGGAVDAILRRYV